MSTVRFSGHVSAQVGPEPVTITVTKPDGSTEVLTAITDDNGDYTVTKEYMVAGNYSAKTHGDEDANYSEWNSSDVPFTVLLQTRTGTLEVLVS